jgi:hypothetical protein
MQHYHPSNSIAARRLAGVIALFHVVLEVDVIVVADRPRESRSVVLAVMLKL